MKAQTWKEVESVLRKHGATFDHSRGDHFYWRMPNGALVTVHHPKHEIPIGTLLAIYKQAGLR